MEILRRNAAKAILLLSVWGVCCLLMPGNSQAIPINWNALIYEAGADTSVYEAEIEMELDGNTLTIMLRNTSTGDAGEAAFNLLSGLGFDLPTGVSIEGGTARVHHNSTGAYTDSSSQIIILSGGDDVSGEWGWGQGIGQFNTVVPGLVDWDISAMEASTDSIFSSTPLAPPDVLDGPEFGLLSQDAGAGGLNYVQDAIIFDLTLGGDLPDDLLDFIAGGDVVIAFGSPNAIPDASTLFLLGTACIVGFFGFRRKLRE